VDVGDWCYFSIDSSDYWSDMKYRSLEVASPLLGLGVVFFIAFRQANSVCLNFNDINYSIAVLILLVIIQIINYEG